MIKLNYKVNNNYIVFTGFINTLMLIIRTKNPVVLALFYLFLRAKKFNFKLLKINIL
ncbi:MAG: hypothetical protein Kow0068_13520 [Marinilabiliales bacterium]